MSTTRLSPIGLPFGGLDSYQGTGGGGGGDVTAPNLSSASGSGASGTVAVGSVVTDEAGGTLSWVITTSATAPSAAQVKAGQDHTGSAAVDAGSQAVGTVGQQQVIASGLTPETTYYFHFQQVDASANDSDVASSASFDTPVASSGTSRSRVSRRGRAIWCLLFLLAWG